MGKKYGGAYRRALYNKAKQEKKCTGCSRKVEANRRQYLTCYQCSRRHKRQLVDEIQEQTGLERPYRGTRKCNDCRKTFDSLDIRKVTCCDDCRDKRALIEERLPFDQARYDEEVHGTMANLASKPLKPGQKNDSKAYARRLQEFREESNSHLPFRRLSQREIEARYTPEYCEQIITRATRNFEACRHVPTLSQI